MLPVTSKRQGQHRAEEGAEGPKGVPVTSSWFSTSYSPSGLCVGTLALPGPHT